MMIPAISAGNTCTRIGDIYTSVTFSLAPGELSTIEGQAGATKSFDLGDLPCPPASVASADKFFYDTSINPGRGYEPRIVPPTQIYSLDPAWATCTFQALNQGFDPPSAVMTATAITGNNQGHFGLLPRHRRAVAHAHAHRAPHHPVITTPPASTLIS